MLSELRHCANGVKQPAKRREGAKSSPGNLIAGDKLRNLPEDFEDFPQWQEGTYLTEYLP